MSSAKRRPFCLGLNVLMVCEPHAALFGMAIGDLVIQGTRVCASMFLAQFWIIPGMAPEGLIDPCHAEPRILWVNEVSTMLFGNG